MAQQWHHLDYSNSLFLKSAQFIFVTCTHIDDGILELDVEPVVRNGNNGFVSVAKILNPFPLKNWERHLRTQNSWIIAVDQCQTIKTRCKQTRTVGLLLLLIVEP